MQRVIDEGLVDDLEPIADVGHKKAPVNPPSKTKPKEESKITSWGDLANKDEEESEGETYVYIDGKKFREI